MSKPLHLHDGTGVVYRDSAGYVLESHGTTVPTDGVTGHHHGATFKHTDGTTDADALYVNVGSLSSANYDPITDVSLSSDLASVADGKGASLIGIEDDGSFTAQVNVEEALQEIYQSLLTTSGLVPLNILSTMLAAGTPMAAWADNASSNPGVTLANAKACGLRWNNNASQTAVYGQFQLPYDIDVTANATIEVYASKTGATLADATTFTVGLFNNATSALHDADTDYGGATGAMTGDATAKTVQKVTRTVTAADLGVAGAPVTFSIKPTDGTLGTDDVIVHAVNLKYKRKLLTV